MSYLLDTCVISETVKRRPSSRVLAWLEAQSEEALFLSVLVLGELHKGIEKLSDEERKGRLARWVAGELRDRFSGRVLPIDAAVAQTWGAMQGQATRLGRPMPVIDSLIAATAKVHDLSVVTRNVADYATSGVRVVNPW